MGVGILGGYFKIIDAKDHLGVPLWTYKMLFH